MFTEVIAQIEQAQNDGKHNYKIPVSEKTNTLQLFAFLKKSGYSPSFESDREGNAYIEVQLKPVSFSSKIIDLKTRVQNRVVSIKKNVIEVNFSLGSQIEDKESLNNENNVVILKNTRG